MTNSVTQDKSIFEAFKFLQEKVSLQEQSFKKFNGFVDIDFTKIQQQNEDFIIEFAETFTAELYINFYTYLNTYELNPDAKKSNYDKYLNCEYYDGVYYYIGPRQEVKFTQALILLFIDWINSCLLVTDFKELLELLPYKDPETQIFLANPTLSIKEIKELGRLV